MSRRDDEGGPLRIAHLVSTDDFAGTERYICDVSREQARRGHRVRVFGGEPALMRAALPPSVPWAPGKSTLQGVLALVRAGRVDVVHTHLGVADVAGALAAPVHRGRHFSTRHVLVPRGARGVKALLGDWARSRLTEIAVSRFVAEQVRPPSDVVVVNGVPSSLVAAPDPAERERVVLLAQRLVPGKRSMDALLAFHESGLAAHGWRLAIAGSGEDAPELLAAGQRLGVADSVDHLGWVGDLGDLWRRVGLFVAPAAAEPLGLSVLEAMAHEVPVIASDAAGHRETVGSVPGSALHPVGDVPALAALLRSLGLDDARRAAYGRELAAAQRERFSVEHHVDQLEALYRAPRTGRGGRVVTS